MNNTSFSLGRNESKEIHYLEELPPHTPVQNKSRIDSNLGTGTDRILGGGASLSSACSSKEDYEIKIIRK